MKRTTLRSLFKADSPNIHREKGTTMFPFLIWLVWLDRRGCIQRIQRFMLKVGHFLITEGIELPSVRVRSMSVTVASCCSNLRSIPLKLALMLVLTFAPCADGVFLPSTGANIYSTYTRGGHHLHLASLYWGIWFTLLA